MAEQREYKDRLFKFIFGNPENKEWTLSLYNAINNSNHTNADEIEFTTIEDAVYMGMKNDVSFIVCNVMNFYEQQSTYNPNIPLRILIYAGMVYSKYIENTKTYRRYSSKLQKIPTPKCVCFYNGTRKQEERKILKLSDAYDGEGDIEVSVLMININYGYNKELLNKCKPLSEYSLFVDEVRVKREEYGDLSKAIDAAIDRLAEDSQLKQFLIANKAEVKLMCITEYDEEKTMYEMKEEAWEEGRAEGRAEGKAEGKLSTLISLVQRGLLNIKNAADEMNLTVEAFEAKMNSVSL